MPGRRRVSRMRRGLLAGAIVAAGRVRAVFSRADVAGQVAARLPVAARSAASTLARVEELTDQALGLSEAVPVGEHPKGVTARASDGRWASAEVLAAEARILSFAERGRAGGYGPVPAELGTLVADRARTRRRPAQRARHLTLGGDFLTVLTAPAGAGKTSTASAPPPRHGRTPGTGWSGSRPRRGPPPSSPRPPVSRADTFAKWLHNQGRLRTLPRFGAGLVRPG